MTKLTKFFCLILFLTLCHISVRAAIADGTEVYILNDYYNKVIGLNADGTTPRISDFGHNADAESYVMVVERSSVEGYSYLRNKSTGRYLCASTADTWSVKWSDTKGSGDEYLWKLDVQFGAAIVNRHNTSRRLGCDWSDGDDYLGIYYDKQANSRALWSVFPALEGGYEASLMQAETEVQQNSIGRMAKSYFQIADAVEVTDTMDVHIVSATPFALTGSIDLKNSASWIIVENVRPSTVIDQWLQFVTINGRPAVNGQNVRVAIYLGGAAIIPGLANEYAFHGYTDENQGGDVLNLRCQNYATLNGWNNRLRSFVLKRGYMATLASDTDGGGYSRVYVADHADIVVPVMPEQLNRRTSSIHIKRWQYTSKKGWADTNNTTAVLGGASKMNATWYYTWSADRYSTDDCEYVPIRQHIYWPSMSQISGQTASTHVLSFNEPEHSEQHDKCDCGGVIDPWKATTYTPSLATTGMRVGSPAPTDASWLTQYIGHCNDMTYRCDFVAIHSYWGPNEANGASAWYNRLKAINDATKRPVWITEWAYGASWTTESWPSGYGDQLEKNRAAIIEIIDMLERTPFIERYDYYQWDTSSRRLFNDDGWVTPAGKVYRDTKSTFAYNAAQQYIPHWWRPSTKTPTLSATLADDAATFSIGNTNGDCSDELKLQRRRGDDGEWETLYEVTDRSQLDNATLTFKLPIADLQRTADTFRLVNTTILGGSTESLPLSLGYILNPDCNDGLNAWTTSNLETDTKEPYDTATNNPYWNQWKPSGLNSSMTQTTDPLPEGEYTLGALLRSGSNVSMVLKAEVLNANGAVRHTESVTHQGTGSATQPGSPYLNGWQQVLLPTIEMNEGERLRITATATGSGSAWWSADHFTLLYTPPVAIRPTTDDATAPDAVYDLQGRRIPDGAPLPDIYIRNGKKYFRQ